MSAPTVANAVLRGVGWAQGTFGAGGGVLLGRYYDEVKNYMVDAQEIGANYFNLKDIGWKTANYFGDPWVANRAFIDASIARGQQFFLNDAPFFLSDMPFDHFGTYGREVEYLFQSGVQNGQITIIW